MGILRKRDEGTPSPMTYRPDIDGLRAIAVLAVVFFHMELEGFAGGFVGVDVFFVISGFLITGLLVGDRPLSLSMFYERRARRILPALVVVVFASSVLAIIFFMPEELIAFGKSVVATSLFSSNILFWHETGYFDAPRELKPLLHTWSLALEEQFYLVYPLLLIACQRFLSGRLAWVLLPLCLISFLASVVVTNLSESTAFYLAPFRAWEFLLGCIVALRMLPNIESRILRELLCALGLALIVWSIASLSEALPFPGWRALLPCLGAAVLMWLGEDQQTIVGRLLAIRPLVWIGLISYSIYLWHWPLLVFARYITVQDLTVSMRVGLIAATLGAAYLSWRYVEQPVRRGPFCQGWRIVGAGVVSTAASLCVGSALIASGGFPARIAPVPAKEALLHDRRDCHFVTVERVDKGDLCIRGAVGQASPSFVLVGDSHADALSPGLFAAATRVGISGYQFTQMGFRPLPGVTPNDNALTERFVRFLEDNPSLKLVIMAGYWSYQASGISYHDQPTIYRDEEYDGSGLNYDGISFQHGLQNLIGAFPDRRFIIIEDVPVGPQLEISRAKRALHVQRILAWMPKAELLSASFGLSRRVYEQQIATYRPILETLSQRFSNVSLLSLIDVICDGEFCPRARNGVLLFRDGDHLSWAGGLLLSSKFFAAFGTYLSAQQHASLSAQQQKP
jgi:peptidoglycan/LPS O-acetylase OafA/YrhL